MQQHWGKALRDVLRGALRRTHRRKKNSSPWLIGGISITIIMVSYLLREPKAPLKGAELTCTVQAVYDGDTLTARCPSGEVKVRMFGIDSPEMGQKPWGNEAQQALRDLLPLRNHLIRLQVRDQDRYGRTVAQVWVGERDVGLTMVKQGQAVVYEQYNDSPVYRQAQTEAQHAQRGIWKKPGSQQTPAVWRRLNPR